MDNPLFTLLYPFLDKLKNGSIIRQIFALMFRISAVLFALAMLIGAIMSIKQGFREYATWQMTITSLVVAFIILGLGLLIFQIYFYHAKEIEDLGDSPFTLSPIAAIFIRTAGEVYALIFLLVGGISFISLLILGENRGFSLPYHDIPFVGEILGATNNSSFLSGLVVLVYCFVLAFFSLMLSYFIAERIIVATDMATNIRILVNNSEKAGLKNAEVPKIEMPKTNISQHDMPSNRVEATVLQPERKCAKCRRPYELGDTFCESCGNKL